MEQKALTALTNEELLQEAKKTKTTKMYDALFIGFMIGIAIYSSVKNGFGLLSLIPLVYLPIAAKNNARRKAVEQLLKERNLI